MTRTQILAKWSRMRCYDNRHRECNGKKRASRIWCMRTDERVILLTLRIIGISTWRDSNRLQLYDMCVLYACAASVCMCVLVTPPAFVVVCSIGVIWWTWWEYTMCIPWFLCLHVVGILAVNHKIDLWAHNWSNHSISLDFKYKDWPY